jgi:formylmethanofuran dehydrogenase subunit B
VTGADSVLTWQTGYPFSVNLPADHPRYNPSDFSAQKVLERGEADSCLSTNRDGKGQEHPSYLAQSLRLVADFGE